MNQFRCTFDRYFMADMIMGVTTVVATATDTNRSGRSIIPWTRHLLTVPHVSHLHCTTTPVTVLPHLRLLMHLLLLLLWGVVCHVLHRIVLIAVEQVIIVIVHCRCRRCLRVLLQSIPCSHLNHIDQRLLVLHVLSMAVRRRVQGLVVVVAGVVQLARRRNPSIIIIIAHHWRTGGRHQTGVHGRRAYVPDHTVR